MRHLANLLYKIFKTRQYNPVPIDMEIIKERFTKIIKD